MQKPFTLTDEMAKELANEVATLAPQGDDAAHDPAGARAFAGRLRKRNADDANRGGDVPRHQDDPAIDERHSQALEDPATVEQILAQRGTTHGDFTDNARISQMLKDSLRNQHGWGNLNDVQREALDMISHKIGRALAGNPDFKDHWDDIAGYAKLVSQRIG